MLWFWTITKNLLKIEILFLKNSGGRSSQLLILLIIKPVGISSIILVMTMIQTYFRRISIISELIQGVSFAAAAYIYSGLVEPFQVLLMILLDLLHFSC
ncbi:hypothetical protein FQR65_LT07732 [Abscondita terminalis]|nr:hypothetical protein FQR65_LT07732 [Abscondita terminalis]